MRWCGRAILQRRTTRSHATIGRPQAQQHHGGPALDTQPTTSHRISHVRPRQSAAQQAVRAHRTGPTRRTSHSAAVLLPQARKQEPQLAQASPPLLIAACARFVWAPAFVALARLSPCRATNWNRGQAQEPCACRHAHRRGSQDRQAWNMPCYCLSRDSCTCATWLHDGVLSMPLLTQRWKGRARPATRGSHKSFPLTPARETH